MDLSILRKILRDCLRIDRIQYPKAHVLTVAHDNDRSLSFDGKWYSPLIDTLEDDLRSHRITCVSVARIISRIRGSLSYGNALSPEGAFARALIAKRILALWRRKEYPYSSMEEAVWGEILDQTGVKFVIAIQPSRELCAACHKRNVWVADIQHGVIGESHPWYGAAFRAQDPTHQLPHAFLCWDQGSREIIDEWAKSKGIKTVVTGNRWLIRFQQQSSQDNLVKSLSSQFEAYNLNPHKKITILLALSWGEADIPNGFMVDELLRAIQHTSDRYCWYIRLHPNQMNGFATNEGPQFVEYYEKNLKGHIEYEVATKTALPLLLKHIDLVVSWSSSVCIEAAQMGIKTCLLDPILKKGGKRSDYYTYYKKRGYIELIDSTENDIISWLDLNANNTKQIEDMHKCETEYQNLLSFLKSMSFI